MYFRLEIMTDKLHAILGRIEPSVQASGKYDQAVLDLDRDGVFEKTVKLTQSPSRYSKDSFDFAMPLTLDGLNFGIMMQGSLSAPFKGKVSIIWTLENDDAFLLFINGTARFFETSAEAIKGRAFRIGPPFCFDARSFTQGPNAFVGVQLNDQNGSTLRVATVGGKTPSAGKETRILMTFLKDNEKGSSLEAEYG